MPKKKFKSDVLNRRISRNEKDVEGRKLEKLEILRLEFGVNSKCAKQNASCPCCLLALKMAECFVPGFQVSKPGGRNCDSSYLNDLSIYQLCNFHEVPKFIFDDERQEAFIARRVKGKKPIKVVAKEKNMTPGQVKAALDRYRKQMKRAEQIFNPTCEDYKNPYLRDAH